VGITLAAGLLLALPFASGDRLVERGFDHFYNLEYAQALADFEKALDAAPSSPELHNHVAMTLVFQEMLRGGALESEMVTGNNPFLRRAKLNPAPETGKRFFETLAKAMSLAEERLRADPDDTAALYALGISYGLRANWNFLVRKAWRDALRDATEGRKLHNRITAADPSNVDARLTQGLHDYIVGSLPFGYRVLGFMAGIRGDRERGIRTIQEVARKGDRNRVDAEVFLCVLYRRENRPKDALPLLDDLLRRFPRNYLLRFEQAQMYSQVGDKERAIASLDAVAEMKRRGAPGYAEVPHEKIEYFRGNLEFWYRDYDKALEYLGKATASPAKLDLNIGVLAWLRTGQCHDMLGRRAQALEAYGKAVAFAPQADAAREARRYLSSPYRRGER
jgi:tetratricopeptide (TPR) repeat protein